MAIFSFFRTPSPQQYKYMPRFYDADKEDLQARLKQGGQGPLDDTSSEAMKLRIQAGFKRRSSVDRKFQRRQRRKSSKRVIIIAVALIFIAMYLIYSNANGILHLIN